MAGGTPIIVPLIGNLKPLSKSLGSAQLQLAGFATAIGGIAVSATKEFIALDKSVREVGTLLDDVTSTQLGDLEGSIRSVAKDFGLEGEAVGQAFYDSISSTIADENNVEDFARAAAKFSVAGVTEITSGVDLLTSSMNAFRIPAEEAGRVSDVFFATVKAGKTDAEKLGAAFFQVGPAAASAGLAIEDTAGWLAQLTLTGTPTKIAATQIKAALSEISKPGSVLSDTFEDIAGTTFPEFISAGGDLEDALGMIQQSVDGSGKSMFEAAGSIEAVQALLGATGPNAEAFAGTLDGIANSAGAADTAFEVMSAGVGYQMQVLKGTYTDIQYSIGSALVPALLEVVDILQVYVPIGVTATEDALRGFIAFAEPLAQVVIAFFEPVVNQLTGDGVLVTLTTGITDLHSAAALAGISFGGLTVSATSLLVAFKALKPVFLVLKVAALAVSSPIVVAAAAVAAVAAAFIYAYNTIEPFREAVDNVVAFIRDDALDTLRDFGAQAREVFERVLPAVENLVTSVRDTFLPIWTEVVRVFEESLMPIFDALVDFFRNEIQATIEDAGPIFKKLQGAFEAIAPILETLLSFGRELAHEVLERILIPAFESLGEFFITKLLPGISDITNALRDIWIPLFLEVVRVLANVLEPVIRNVVIPVFSWLADLIINVLGNRVQTLIDIFGGLVDFLAGVFTLDFGRAIDGLIAIFWGLIKMALNIPLEIIKAFGGLIVDLLALLAQFALDLPGMLLRATGAFLLWAGELAIDLLAKFGEWAIDFFAWLGQFVLDLPGNLWDVTVAFLDWLGELQIKLLLGFADIAVDIWNWAIDLAGQIPSKFMAIVTAIATWATNLGKTIIEKIVEGIASLAGSIGRKLGEIVSGALDNIPGGGVAKKALGFLGFGAAGGIVTRPTLSVIGEAGPEAVIPLDQMPGAYPLPRGQAASGDTYIVNVDGGLATSAEIGEAVERALQRWQQHKGALDLKVA